MATYQKVGSFQLNTSIGSQAISGLGFQPKVLLFFHTPSTTNVGVPQTANQYDMIGMADGITQRSTWWFEANGNSGLEDVRTIQSDYAIASAVNPADPYYAYVSSLDSDGFTLYVADPPPDVYRVGYLAMGGDDLTGVKVGDFTSGAGPSQSITGVGFQPTGLMVMSLGINKVLQNGGAATGGDFYQTFGVSDGTSSYSIGSNHRDSAVSVKLGGKVQSGNIVSSATHSSPSTYKYRASLTSFDVDGFTLNWTTAYAGQEFFYLAFTGPMVGVGYFQAPTTTGIFTPISGLAFQPNAVITLSSNMTAIPQFAGNGAVGNGVGMDYSIGFATDKIGEQFNTESTGVDFTVTTYGGFNNDATTIHSKYAYNDRSILQEQIAFEAFGTNSLDFNALTTLGANTSAVMYMAIEGDGGGPPPPVDPTGGSGGPDSPDSIFLLKYMGI